MPPARSVRAAYVRRHQLRQQRRIQGRLERMQKDRRRRDDHHHQPAADRAFPGLTRADGRREFVTSERFSGEVCADIGQPYQLGEAIARTPRPTVRAATSACQQATNTTMPATAGTRARRRARAPACARARTARPAPRIWPPSERAAGFVTQPEPRAGDQRHAGNQRVHHRDPPPSLSRRAHSQAAKMTTKAISARKRRPARKT